METFSDPTPVIKEKHPGGRPLGQIWKHFNKGKVVNVGKFEAECKYCSSNWKRGETPVLEEHLANHCPNVPGNILREYLEKIGLRENTSNKKKRRQEAGQTNITAFHDATELPEARINRINRALVKFFICCGISFRIVEHPFFIDFLKELNGGYDPPTSEYLSGRLLESELCKVNKNVNEDIMNQSNLTLALDGWTSGRNQSIWNFIILTPTRKEYLYQLSDLTLNSHTSEYLATKMKEVIEKVGPERISAIVSDNAANVKKAREIITEEYPKIENIRCVSHCINLIACDIANHTFAERLLRRVNILASFFRNSHIAGGTFRKLIQESNIKGGNLKSYCITRWTTSSESVNSAITLKPILEKMVNDHAELLTNSKVKAIIQGRNFFSDFKILAFVLDPLRKAVLSLEARTATLADCYLSLARLGAALKNLPRSFNRDFRNHCYTVMNKRFEEFDDDRYLLYVTLKSGTYARIAKTAMTIGKNLGFDLEQSRALCLQLKQYKEKESPFDFPFGYGFEEAINWWNVIETKPSPNSLPLIALHLFAICPNSASCERGFSTLGWLTNKRRLQLKVTTLESMCKMITYWKSNAKKELSFFGKETKKSSKLSDIELNQIITKVFAELNDMDEEVDFQFEDNLNVDQIHHNIQRTTTNGEIIPDNIVTVLINNIWIENSIDLSHELILNDIGKIPEDNENDLIDIENDKSDNESDNNNNNTSGKGILNYDIDDLLEEFVHDE